MLATAGSLSAAVLVAFVAAAFLVSAWGFFDLMMRAPVACRVAHVSRHRWLLVMGLSALSILTSTLWVLVAHPVMPIIGLGVAASVVGSIAGTWYLTMVRPWIAAQIGFARRRANTN